MKFRTVNLLNASPRSFNVLFAAVLLLTLFLFVSPVFFVSGYSSNSPSNSHAGAPQFKCESNCTFVASSSTNVVYVLSSKGKLLTNVTLPSGGCGYGPTQVGHKVFIGDLCKDEVDVISLKTLTVVASYHVNGEPLFSVYVPTTKLLYVASFDTGVIPINPRTGAISKTIQICSSGPEYLAYNQVDGLIYAPGRSTASCYSTINPKTGNVTNYKLGTNLNGVACDQKTGNCYITDLDNNVVYEVKGGSVLHTITCDCYWGLAYSPKTGEIYATDYNQNAILVIKGSTIVQNISLSYSLDNDCYKTGKIIAPMQGGPPALVSAINKHNIVKWTTSLGDSSKGGSCG